MRPHRRQPTRLPCPWDSPGKNTGVGCHSFSNAWKWKVKSESEVIQSCLTLNDPIDCSLPGFSAHGIFQARVLEWGAIAFFEPEIRTRRSDKKVQNYFGQLNFFSCWTNTISKADTLLGTGCIVGGAAVKYYCITNYPEVSSLKERFVPFYQQGWLSSASLLVWGLSCSCSQRAAEAGHWRWGLIWGGELSAFTVSPCGQGFLTPWYSKGFGLLIWQLPSVNERRSQVSIYGHFKIYHRKHLWGGHFILQS